MKSKRGLGKGLQALIPEEKESENKDINKLDINKVFPNKNQPRTKFDKEKLEELSVSVKEHGIIQPIVVTAHEKGYQIVAGERRWRAAKMAGLKEVPVIIMELDDKEIMELALIENLQREDLNEIEAAIAYRDLIDKYDLTQQEISERIGKSRASIANTLRLLNLSVKIRKMIVDETISPGHGRCLLSVEGEDREVLLDAIIKSSLSVREAEKMAQKLKLKKPEDKHKKNEDPRRIILLRDLQEKIQSNLGTKVRINEKDDKGKIEIEFYNSDDLERLTEILLK
ncbi:ParB/RepB/Spo0J family partition protein [Alkalibacter mobilis]|uniref:ParB/RepB/Spo0J family partition protein n=1 Tax=Alkalibacter mobilis TaxID=2787712 RepID=UPI00189D6F63|nr:ParB/RepB/Spo0J family partition protein [Alkalibacter mobilis]MBF7096074.1 ParB/RepB/Spo0J family partition protein [Alkalibacter mobilis]